MTDRQWNRQVVLLARLFRPLGICYSISAGARTMIIWTTVSTRSKFPHELEEHRTAAWNVNIHRDD